LTAGQVNVCEEIFTDMEQAHPMHRLVQGEVGSGKTVCALRAMLAVVDSGGQAALLAPTEVLAQQHYRSIRAMLGDIATEESIFDKQNSYSTKVALLTGSLKTAAKRSANLDIVSGAAGIVIGTHAILQQHVDFHELGLVVVDEQHRFGVEQRAALAAKAPEDTRPHVLVMTATPIPRTVAMTVFGDLDISTLSELPAGRSPIATHLVPAAEKPQFLERTWQRVREEVAKGHQVYVVCPRIASNESEDSDELLSDPADLTGTLSNVEDMFVKLQQGPLFGLRIAKLHGQMHPDEKDEVMKSFAAGLIDVVIATTVIEVGVDVPNASVMVIMDADRFGVSQLHQLRGRVGRGGVPGLCLLVTYTLEDSTARRRLDAVCATTDGFELSRVDLEQRREGDVLGASQSGRRSSLKILNVLRDEEIIESARLDAMEIIAVDHKLDNHLPMKKRIFEVLEDERATYLDKA
jgi:ATP-dependent DNA helicase RecG